MSIVPNDSVEIGSVIGFQAIHRKFGRGTVISLDENYVYVKFDGCDEIQRYLIQGFLRQQGEYFLHSVVGLEYAVGKHLKLLKAQERKKRKDDAKEAELRMLDRHKANLANIGRDYLGVRPSSESRVHRVSHCYSCKKDLDNTVDVECVSCGWILCRCGACGCGWSGRR